MTHNGNAITPAKRFTTKGVHVGRLKEMLHNTPQVNTPWDGIHPPCTSPTALASGGIDPDRTFSEDYSPAQMVVDLQAGSIDGYCVGNLGTSGAQLKGLALPWLRI